jgi:hypothetical protein
MKRPKFGERKAAYESRAREAGAGGICAKTTLRAGSSRALAAQRGRYSINVT